MPSKPDAAIPVRVRKETYDLLSQLAKREERQLVQVVDRAVRYYAARRDLAGAEVVAPR